jgi:hypothetical protein
VHDYVVIVLAHDFWIAYIARNVCTSESMTIRNRVSPNDGRTMMATSKTQRRVLLTNSSGKTNSMLPTLSAPTQQLTSHHLARLSI